MEYLYYLLVISVLVAVCFLALRRSLEEPPQPRTAKSRNRGKTSESRGELPDPEPLAQHRAVLSRELRRVPTPWGWPGSDPHQAHGELRYNGQGHSLQHWADWLTREKRTIDDDEYRLRRNASLRALLEDRFGRVVEPASQRYERVKPPRLRDPSLPYDQQDNFASGKTEQIISGLARQPGRPAVGGLRVGRQSSLKDVKTPWGW